MKTITTGEPLPPELLNNLKEVIQPKEFAIVAHLAGMDSKEQYTLKQFIYNPSKPVLVQHIELLEKAVEYALNKSQRDKLSSESHIKVLRKYAKVA